MNKTKANGKNSKTNGNVNVGDIDHSENVANGNGNKTKD